MKRSGSLMFGLALVFVFLFAFPEFICAQHTFPDYSKWQLVGTANYPAVHNGNKVTLFVGVYASLDADNLIYETDDFIASRYNLEF
jgi:hypothetical protein